MAKMLEVLNLRVMEMARSSPVALAKSSNSAPFSSAKHHAFDYFGLARDSTRNR